MRIKTVKRLALLSVLTASLALVDGCAGEIHSSDSNGVDGPRAGGRGPANGGTTAALGSVCIESSRTDMKRYFSAEFEMSCAGCHGTWGEGHAEKGIPALPGRTTSEADFLKVVRAGRAHSENMYMPAFGPDAVDDTTLRADYALMLARGADARQGAGTMQAGPEFAPEMSELSRKQAFADGQVAFQTVGTEGSCQGCHAMGADLARIKFRDSDILRRCVGQAHASDVCTKIVGRVHAMRAGFETPGFCDPRKPFLQPGHAILEGDTPEERDVALIDEFERHGIAVSSEWVHTEDDALRILDALRSTGFMNIRVGYPMNRWTRDSYFGKSQLSSAEWIPSYPHMPLSGHEKEWNLLFERYLEEPTGKHLWAITDQLDERTNNEPAYYDEREKKGCEPVFLPTKLLLGCEVSDCACDDMSCKPVPDPSFVPGLTCAPLQRDNNGKFYGVWSGGYGDNSNKWEPGIWPTHGVSRLSSFKYRAVLLANHLLLHNSYELPKLLTKQEGERALTDRSYEAVVGNRGVASMWDVGQSSTAGGAPHGRLLTTGITPAVLEDMPFAPGTGPGSIDYDVHHQFQWMELSAMLSGTTQVIPAADNLEYYGGNFGRGEPFVEGVKGGDGLLMPIHQFYRLAVLTHLSYAEFADPDYPLKRIVPGNWSSTPDTLGHLMPTDLPSESTNDAQQRLLNRFMNNYWRIVLLRETSWIERTGECDTGLSIATWLRPYKLAKLKAWLVATSPSEDKDWVEKTVDHLDEIMRTCNRSTPLAKLEEEIKGRCQTAVDTGDKGGVTQECSEFYGYRITQ